MILIQVTCNLERSNKNVTCCQDETDMCDSGPFRASTVLSWLRYFSIPVQTSINQSTVWCTAGPHFPMYRLSNNMMLKQRKKRNSPQGSAAPPAFTAHTQDLSYSLSANKGIFYSMTGYRYVPCIVTRVLKISKKKQIAHQDIYLNQVKGSYFESTCSSFNN